MTKKKTKVVMPASIRSKMMGATAMLLVAAILMVSTTYAWFTLSTAPEVTGITTQVGANGNLEIALLTTDTFSDTSSISSSTGDSSSATNGSAVKANVTWGNLVDLSSSTYGLTDISLLPAALNTESSAVNITSPLKIPEYGADGRVADTDGKTVTAIKSGSAFTYDSTSQTYGVRAVGVASNLSSRQLAYTSAKSGFTAASNSATVSTVAAISTNSSLLMGLALGTTTTMDKDALEAALAIAQGMKADLATILTAYKDYCIAAAAATDSATLTDEAFDNLKSLINAASASTLASVAASYGGTTYSAALTALATAQTGVDSAITELSGKVKNYSATVSVSDVSTSLTALLGGTGTSTIPHVTEGTKIYMKGGALATIADNAGAFVLGSLGYTLYAAPTATTGSSNVPAGTLTGITVPTGTFEAASANITDTYGYVLDFAFRTNASSSNLLLQTAAENRVYSDGSNGTQGSGSNINFTYTSGLSATQAKAILGALRITFYDPATGAIYATAACGEVNDKSTYATADLYLISSTITQYTLGQEAYTAVYGTGEASSTVQSYKVKDDIKSAYDANPNYYTNYAETLTIDDYKALNSKTTESTANTLSSDKGAIAALNQNEVKKVSALVYLDGENIDNTAVINAASSGTLDLNLQFSSSAELTPMSNTALKTLTAAEITGTAPTTTTGTSEYKVSATGKTVKSVVWSSDETTIATVSESTNDTVTVTGVAAGTATIKAVVTFTDNTTATATTKVVIPGTNTDTQQGS
jgi:hypothetical protein